MNKILTGLMQMFNKHKKDNNSEQKTEPKKERKTKVKEKIKKLLEQLNTGIYEKEEVMSLALLSSIAGESIFLLGPPGVAKSLIARRLKYAYKDATVFEYLMSRFSTPDEIFGPVSISELKKDKYVRIVKNYLPAAQVVFLDEIWKAGPSIQNALLTILNEKKYRNGENEIDVPMKALISASNELPEKDQGLEALWDRFLVRLVVDGISDTDNFNKMITMPSLSGKEEDEKLRKIITETINDDKEWNQKINEINIPENVLNVIKVIKDKIEDYNNDNEENKIYISDRRWRKIIRLMRTSAFLNDRAEIDLMDCFLIYHCIWNKEEQKDTVWQFIISAVEEHGYSISFDFEGIKQELAEYQTEIENETQVVINKKNDVVYNNYYQIEATVNNNNLLIGINEYNNLTNINQNKILCCFINASQQIQNAAFYKVKKGNSMFSIFINDAEYNLKTTVTKTAKKPHPSVEKTWDEKAENFLQHTGDIRNQIEQYKNKDLKHLRTNLFVESYCAYYVESNINKTQKEAEKIELEIREIQNGYKIL